MDVRFSYGTVLASSVMGTVAQCLVIGPCCWWTTPPRTLRSRWPTRRTKGTARSSSMTFCPCLVPDNRVSARRSGAGPGRWDLSPAAGDLVLGAGRVQPKPGARWTATAPEQQSPGRDCTFRRDAAGNYFSGYQGILTANGWSCAAGRMARFPISKSQPSCSPADPTTRTSYPGRRRRPGLVRPVTARSRPDRGWLLPRCAG